ncbi:MAG: PEP-CTERM sorting domain-containing protein [Pirellulaceae bacterium]
MRCLCLALVCAVFASTAKADVLLFEDFEDNIVTFTPSQPLYHDGASDYFHIVPLNGAPNSLDPFTGFQGSNFFAVEDIDDGGTRPSQGILTFSVSGTGLNTLTVDLLFAAGGNTGAPPAYDSDDGFLVRASLNGGGTWQNLLAFEAAPGVTNQLLRQDTDFDGVGDGFIPGGAFTAFNGLTIAGTTNNLLVQVIFDSNDGNGEMAIDSFRINGFTNVPEPSALSLIGMIGAGMLLRRRRRS